jgi:hypothetical protein
MVPRTCASHVAEQAIIALVTTTIASHNRFIVSPFTF